MADYGHKNYGAKVNLSIWEPKVSPTQFSSASMLIAGGSKEQFQSIRAGWIVSQKGSWVFDLIFLIFHFLNYISSYIKMSLRFIDG